MKPLAGKRAFYAMGVRSMNYPNYGAPPDPVWPEWAQAAYRQGQSDERWSRARQTVKTWPASKLVEAT